MYGSSHHSHYNCTTHAARNTSSSTLPTSVDIPTAARRTWHWPVLLLLLSSQLCNVVHEVFSSILIDIQGTDMNSMVSLQLTNLGYFRFLVGTKYAMLNFTCNLILFLIISPLHSSYGNLQTLMIKICQQKMCLTKLLMHVKQQIRS